MFSPDDAVELTAHLAELTSAGVPLSSGFRALAEEYPRGELARRLNALADQIDAGKSLQAALRDPVSPLSGSVRELLIAGAESGNLPGVLEQLARQERMNRELRRRLWESLAYPIVIFVILIGWLIFMAYYIVPPFKHIFDDFGVRLPILTEFVIWMASKATIFIVVISCLFVAFVVAKLLFNTDLWSGVPLVGALSRNRALAEFAGLLGTLVRQRVPLPEALRLTASGNSSRAVAHGCRRGAELVARGAPLSSALGANRVFPRTLGPILQSGEQHGTLGESLDSAAQWFFDRTETQAELMRVTIPPVFFFIIISTAGLTVFALFLPLIKLIQDLSH